MTSFNSLSAEVRAGDVSSMRVGRGSRRKSVQRAVMAECEKLETRQMLSGTWTTVNTAIPGGGAQNAVVLSDGSIMVHGGNDSASNKWYDLKPNNGLYNTGSWTTLTASPTYRLFDATEVLPNGNVMVLGGEYSGTTTTDTFINTGEVYNPLTNAWTAMTTFPQSSYGDDPTEMLPNGSVLCGYISSSLTYLWNPATNAWSTTGSKLYGDRSDEESWVKLPDDSILSYDVFSSISTGTPTAQRYIPSTGTWVAAGTLPAQLSAANVGYEMGPGLMLPNGIAFFAGGTNATAYYNPSTNAWTAGPNMPNGDVMADAPGAVLPNGDLLLAMSPRGGTVGGGYNFPSPTYVYELNTTTGVFTNVTPSLSGFSTGSNSFAYSMTVLPTGQVMFFNDSGAIAIYTDSGSPSASWAPTITNITNDAGTGTFTLTGYQLNGISEGAAYGDDNEMSSNYPLVRLTDQNGNVSYARTFNWTLDGISSASSSVSFTEPATGSYLVSVVANGIASSPVLNVQAGSNGENWAVQVDPNNTAYVAVNQGENGATSYYFPLSSFSELIMTGDAANNTLVINDNLGGKQTVINGGNGTNDLDVENNGTGAVSENGASGTDYYDFSEYAQNLSNVSNYTVVNGSYAGNEQIRMYDNLLTTAATYSVTGANVTRSGFGGMGYGVPVDGILLITGEGSDTVNVTGTFTGTPVALNSSGGADVINIGSNGSLAAIDASITVSNRPSYSTININDSADTTLENFVQIYSNTTTGSMTGLAPVAIYWTDTDIDGINIIGSGGGTDFYITSTGIPSFYTTTINTSAGTNVVDFENAIAGLFSVTGNSTTSVAVYDDDATTAQSWLLTSSAVTRAGFTLDYAASIGSLTLQTGTGNDTVDAESTSVPTNIYNGGGYDAFNIATGSKDLLGQFAYGLNVDGGPAGSSTLTIDNSQYPYISYTTITSSNFSGGAYISYADISTLTLNLPRYSNIVYVTSTFYNTSYVINSGAGNDEVDVGKGDLTGVLALRLISEGGITYNAGSGDDELLLDDSQSSVPQNYNFTPQSITNGAQLAVFYNTSLKSVVLYAGSGNDTDSVAGTYFASPLTINEGSGNVTGLVTVANTLAPVVINAGTGTDAFTVGATGGNLNGLNALVSVNGQGGVDTLTINDLADANSNASSSSFIQLFSNVVGYQVNYSNMSSIAINTGAGGSGNTLNVTSTPANTPVTVNNNSGTDTINVNSTAVNGPVIISPSSGNDPINVGTAGLGNAVAEFVASQQIGALTIGNGGIALVPTGARKLLQINTIATTGAGVLNMTTNDLIDHQNNLPAVNAEVKSGLNIGSVIWAGPGITSSSAAANPTLMAMGAILNTYDGGSNTIFNSGNPFDGASPGVSDVLVKYTYYGDANLSGAVDASDYSLIDNGYVSHLAGWYNGDFNYDGVVNGSDYALIDNAFNEQGTSLAAQVATPAAVVARNTAVTTQPTFSNNVIDRSNDSRKKVRNLFSELLLN